MSLENFSILQWNCRSISANGESLPALIHKHRPSIVLLNETWLKTHTRFSLRNYTAIRNDRPDGYGGVAILIHKNVPFTRYTTAELISTSPSQTSTLAVKISDENVVSKPIVICTVYIPSTSNISSFQFQHFFNSLTHTWIVAGDFNAKSHSWLCHSINHLGNSLEDALLTIPNVLLNPNTPTHISGNTLDLSFVSANLALMSSWTVECDTYGSDHYPTVITLQQHIPTNPAIITQPTYLNTRFNLHKTNIDKFQSFLIKNVPSFQNFNTNLLTDYHSFITLLDAAINYSTKSSQPPSPQHFTSHYTSPIWWTPECTKLIKERKRAFRLWKETLSNIAMLLN